MIRIACVFISLLVATVSVAQNNFRSRQSGDWNQSSTWEEFVAGSWQLTANTPDFNSGTITLQNTHIVTTTASVTIDQTTIQAGSTLVVNNAIVVTLNNGTGNDLVNSGSITLSGESFIDGAGNIVHNGNLSLGSLNSTGALVTGTTVGNIRISGLRTYSNGSRVIYNGTAAQFIGSGHPGNLSSGVVSELDNANGLTWNTVTGSNFTGGGTLYFPGNLILTQGSLNIVSASGVARTLYFTAGITANSNFITLAGPAVNITIGGSGNLNFPSPAGTQTIGNLTISRPANTISFPSALNVTTRLTSSGIVQVNGTGNVFRDIVVNSGSVDFNGSASTTGSITLASATTLFFEGQLFSLAGDYVSSGGTLSSDASSTLTLTGSSALTSALTFTGGSQLNTFTLNKFNVGTSATINSAVTITNAFNLSAGTLSIVGGNLSLSSGATLTKSNSGTIITSSPSGGPWNLIYTGTSQTTSLEIPASGSLNSLTINTNSSTTITLSQDIDVVNALSIPSNSRTFTSGTNNVAVGSLSNTGVFNAPTSGASTGLTVSGNFANNGTFTHNNGTLIIAGSSVMSGTQINNTIFNTISITAAGSLTPSTTLNIRSNFTNDGTFTAGTGTVIFNGTTSTLSGTAINTTTFYNVTVNSGATLIPASNFILLSNLVMNGSYTAGTGTITFNGTSTLSGTTISSAVFNDIQINATRSLTASNITLGLTGNFTNDGTFNPGTTGTMSFSGTSILSGLNINTTSFIHILINNLATVTPPTIFNVVGNFTNNGTFNSGTGAVLFNGNPGSRILSGTTNTQFYDVTLNKTNGGVSLTVSSAQTVTNSLTLTDGILDNPSGNLTVSSGATITKSSNGIISTAPPSGGPWSLIYVTATQPTGLEIPASGNLNNLTVDLNNASAVNLGQSITVSGAFNIVNPGRTFTSGANNVSLGSFTSAGTFNAPTAAASTGLTVSGNFANNGTFVHNSGLTTFSGTTTLSGSSSTTFNRLTISGILNTSVNFALAGHFTNNGTFNGGTTTVTFSGTALQNISGSAPLTTFQNITITNGFSPTSVSVESNVNLVGTLTLGTSAKLDADGAAGTAVLTLLSTNDSPAVDASIAALPASAQVNGSVTVQRYFRPADNFDRFISSPVSNGPVSQIQASTPAGSFPITGSFTGTSFPCTGCGNNGDNLRYYREATTGTIGQGYTGWITANTNTLVPGVGYDAFMWNGVSNTTVSFRGTINRGSINLGVVTGPPSNSITRTNNAVPSADGWNLVGNPYPSAIQWNNGAGWTKTNIDPTVWVWDVVGRVWHSFNANTSVGDLTNGVIATGQGFWVYVSSVGAGSITINEQAKSVAGAGTYYRQSPMATLKMSLSGQDFIDNAFLVIDELATDAFDAGLDAPKMELGIERLSVSFVDTENTKLAHFAVKQNPANDTPISVKTETEGEYTLSFNSLNAFPGFEDYYLVDSYVGTSSKISSGAYKFTVTPNPQSYAQRFYLSLNPITKETNNFEVTMSCYPNPTTDNLSIELNSNQVRGILVMDQMGRVVNNVSFLSKDGITRAEVTMRDYSKGVYVVKVVTDGKLFIEKIIKH